MIGWRSGSPGTAFQLPAVLAVVVLAAAPAAAQPRLPRVQVSAAGLWVSAVDLGGRAATETSNQPGGGRYTLFETTSELGRAVGLEVRVTVRVRRAWAVEVGGSWGRRRLATSVSGDVEGGASLTAAADLDQYGIDGSVRLSPARLARAQGRVAPFILAGVGHVRQVYSGGALVATGTFYHAGGGVLVWFGAARPARPPRLGARGDVRWSLQDGGVTLGGPRRRHGATAAGGVVVQF